MSTKFLSPGWRMPRNANQSKQASYSLHFTPGSVTNVNLGDALSFFIGSFSASMWVKSPDNGKEFFSRYISANGVGNFRIGCGANAGATANTVSLMTKNLLLSGSTDITDGNWHHVCVTMDAISSTQYTRTIYVDGSQDAQDTVTLNTYVSTSSSYGLNLGCNFPNSGHNNVDMSEVSIFDYALSPGQVTTLWGGGTSVSNPMALPSPPIAYYPLGTSAYNGEYLAENNAIGDYVFDNTISSRIFTPINVSNLTNVTQSVWFKTSTNAQSNKYIFFVGQYGTFVLQLNGTNTLRAGVTVNPLTQTYPSLTFNYADGKWHQYIMNYDGSHIKLYVDGILRIKTARTGTLRDEPTYFTTIGNVGTSANAGAIGEYSNFVAYEHTLTDGGVAVDSAATGEIATLYNYGSPIQTLASIPQNSNLKAWYKLDASEVYNSSTTEWSIDNNQNPSAYQSSLDFVSNDHIQIPSTTNFAFGTSGFTISLWVNFDALTSGGYNILDFRTSGSGTTVGSLWVNSTNGLRWYVNGGYLSANIPAASFSNNTWYNVIILNNGSTTSFYLNGTSIDSASDTTSYTAAPLTIGDYSNGGYALNGKLSNLAIFNTALTTTNVTSLYNNGTPLADMSSFTSLVSWYKLNNTTTGIEDSKGSNNGTNNGATEYPGFVNTLVGDSSGMSQANLVQSDLQTVAPYSKYAMNFDGTDSVTVGSLFGQVQDVFSVSTWVNFTSNPGYQMILSDNIWLANYTANNIGLDIKNSSGSYYDNNGGVSQGTNFVIPSDLRTNEWINVAFSYVGSSSGTTAVIKMYLNGAEVVNTTVTYSNGNANLQNASNFYLGSRNGSSFYLNGSLSNLSIWNYALTASQVREIYNQGLPSDLNTFSGTAPVAWWQLGENSSYVSGWTFADEIASNNGTSGNLPETALTNGVGTTANGVSSGMSEGNLIGDAPYSTANAISSGIAVTARGTDVPPTP